MFGFEANDQANPAFSWPCWRRFSWSSASTRPARQQSLTRRERGNCRTPEDRRRLRPCCPGHARCAGRRGEGRTRWGNGPAELGKYRGDAYAKVGSLFQPDFEAVAALEPDLIVVGSRSQKHFAALSEIAPVLDLTADNNDFRGSVKRNAEAIGKLFGKEARLPSGLRKLDATDGPPQRDDRKPGQGPRGADHRGKISAYGPGSRFPRCTISTALLPQIQLLRRPPTPGHFLGVRSQGQSGLADRHRPRRGHRQGRDAGSCIARQRAGQSDPRRHGWPHHLSRSGRHVSDEFRPARRGRRSRRLHRRFRAALSPSPSLFRSSFR